MPLLQAQQKKPKEKPVKNQSSKFEEVLNNPPVTKNSGFELFGEEFDHKQSNLTSLNTKLKKNFTNSISQLFLDDGNTSTKPSISPPTGADVSHNQIDTP